MLLNYLKLAFRNIYKNKVFSFINVVGLAAGLALSFCIIIYITYELSYDKQNVNYNGIYRIDSEWAANNWRMPFTCIPLAKAAKESVPGIDNYARLIYLYGAKLQEGSNEIESDNKYFADPSLFNVFTFHFIQGSPEHALSDINSIVLSEDVAIKCFGRTDVLGKLMTIKMDSISLPVKVTGVLKRELLPATISPDVIFPLKLLYKLNHFYRPDDWIDLQVASTYFLLNSKTNQKDMESRLYSLYHSSVSDTVNRTMDVTFHVVPLGKTYFVNSEFQVPKYMPVIKIDDIVIYSGIGILVLFLACINFILLTAAKSNIRNIEIGVRKVIGASRRDIASLLIIESAVTSIIAFPLSLFFIELIFPLFEGIINRKIDQAFYAGIPFLAGFWAISLIIGLLSGLYSAFYFSRVNPAQILRRKFNATNKSVNLKRVLISFQMVAFISLLISSIVVKSQLDLTHKKEMGFDTNNYLYLNCHPIKSKVEVLKNSLRNCPDIIDMAYTLGVFPYTRGNRFGVSRADDPGKMMSFGAPLIGFDYPRMANMHLIAGEFPTLDNYRGKTLINETAARELGFKSPIGKNILFLKQMKRKIIGVVKDFNLNSLHDKIRPVAMILGNFKLYLVIKYSPGKLQNAVSYIKSAWSEISGAPVQITYLDEKIDSMYRNERRFSKAIDYFTAFAILIAGMGLFGIIYFSTQRRLKEIGIRKILGASVFKIASLVLKEIVTLIIISTIIAAPIAYLFMHKWLQDFAFRISISWWMFLLAGSIALTVALLTVSYQVIKAAKTNPAEILRSE